MGKCSTTWINCKLLKISSTSISFSSVYRLSFILDKLLLFFIIFWTICIVLDIVLDIYLSILHAYSDHFCPLSLYGTKRGRHIVHVDFGYWMLLMIIVILYACGFWILDVINDHCCFVYMWILDIGCY